MNDERQFITLAEASLGTPYSQEYLSLLARRGKLPSKKNGRNWVTTREAVEEYIISQQKLLIQEITQRQNLIKNSINVDVPDASVIQAHDSVIIQSDNISDEEHKSFLKKVYAGDSFFAQYRNPDQEQKKDKDNIREKAVDAKISNRIRSDVVTYTLAIILFFGMGNFLMSYSSSDSLLGAVAKTQRTISSLNFLPAAGFNFYDSFSDTISQLVDSLYNNFSRITENFGKKITSLFMGSESPTTRTQTLSSDKAISQLPSPHTISSTSESRKLSPSSPVVSQDTNSTNRIVLREQLREVTQVREITERKEYLIPVDLALLKQEFLANIDTANKIIRDRFDDAISRLQMSLARTSGRTESSINMVSLSQKIDALNNLSVTNGVTLDSGNLDVIKGSVVVSSGGVNLSAGNLVLDKGSVSILGTATSSWSDAGLAVGGGGLATSRGLTISGGSLLNQSSATSSFANGIQLTAGCFRLSDGTCAGTGGGGTPGGLDTQVQFNDGSSFGGDSAFIWNKNTNVLTIAGGLITTLVTSTSATTTELWVANSAQIASSTIGGQLTIGFLNATSSTATSTIFDSLIIALTNQGNVGIGTSTTPADWKLQVASTSPFLVLSDTDATRDFKHWTLSSNSGNFYLATASDAYATATIPAFTIATSGSTTIASILNVGGSGTSTITGAIRVASTTATSTFVGNIATNLLNVTSTSASSTFAGGIVVAGGVKVSTYNCSVGYSNSGKLTTDANGYLTCANDNGGSLGGNNTAVQFNNAGSFGGDETTFSWDNTNKRLGIGTSSPMAQLSIDTDTNPYAIWVGDKGGANASTTPFFAITGSGQILIGTTTGTSTPQPNWTVQIASTSPFLTLSDTDATLNQKHWTLSSNSGNFFIASATDAYATTSIPAFTITNGGKFGVGSTTPMGRFSIESDTDPYAFWVSGKGTSSPYLTIRANGTVGIGTSSPATLFNFADATTTSRIGVGTTTYTFAVVGGIYFDSSLITIGSTTGSSILSYLSTATSTIANNQLYAWTIATSTTATPLLRFNTTAGQRATTSIRGGFEVDTGAFEYDSSSGVTSIDSLSSGPLKFDTNAGIVSWIDMPVDTTTQNVVESYTAQIDGVNILTIYAETNTGGFVSTTTVGIGTTTPKWTLQIASTSPFLTLSDTDATLNQKHWTLSSNSGSFFIASATDAYATTSNITALTITNGGNFGIASTTPFGQFSIEAGTNPYPLWIGDMGTSSPYLVVRSNGTVGIGTSSPARFYSGTGTTTGNYASSTYLFSVAGGVYLDSNIITIGSSSASLLTINYQAKATTTIANNQPEAWTIATSTTATPLLRFNTTAGQRATTSIRGGFEVDTGAFEYDSSSGVTSIDSLNIGGQSFDTDAGIISWIDLPSSTSTPRVSIVNSYTAAIGGKELFTLYSETTPTAGVVSTTTVGIGTTTPQWTLQIASTSPFVTLSDTDAARNQKHWTLSSNSGNFFIATASDAFATTSGFATTSFTIASSGVVGIATTVPTSASGTMLAVEGGIRLQLDRTSGPAEAVCHSGDDSVLRGVLLVDCVNTPVADYAEQYPVEEGITYGDIVAIGSGATKTIGGASIPVLTKTAKPYQSNILGVVSRNYSDFSSIGYNIKKEDNPYPVALNGRVPVHISTEGGHVKRGDRITSSSLPGIAMKAEKNGVGIGIALEDFDNAPRKEMIEGKEVAVGQILVFINLGYATLDGALTDMSNIPTPTNAWSVNQMNGKVNVAFFGDVNMQGNAILDIGKITGYLGTWSIGEDGTLSAMRVVSGDVTTNTLSVKDKILFGTREQRIGITLYDETTGDPYCMKIKQGAVVSDAGECTASQFVAPEFPATSPSTLSSTPPPAPPTTPPPVSPPTPSPPPASQDDIILPSLENATTTENIATTTLEMGD